MVAKKPRIVIIGAGMAGLAAASKLYTSMKEQIELCVVEGGNRMGGRINTSEFGGARIEMGATYIHGIVGSPVHKIAQEINSLESDQPWECMDGLFIEPVTLAEGGYEVNPFLVKKISNLFDKLMNFSRGKLNENDTCGTEVDCYKVSTMASKISGKLSLGSFLRQGLDAYWDLVKDKEELKGYYGEWSRKLLEEAIFGIHENTQRTYTSASDLLNLDYEAESGYILFPGEEITIAKGYMSIIESLASVLPSGSIQLDRKVARIEWQNGERLLEMENGDLTRRSVKLHFCDGSVMLADHVIVTVSLGVLKSVTREEDDLGMFDPPLPSFKKEAISRLGFGVVNKLFLQLSPTHYQEIDDSNKFPSLQMAFHRADSGLKDPKIPWWIRRTASLCPIYGNSNVLLSWFAGKEALELESLKDDEILNGVSTTISTLFSNSHDLGNGNLNSLGSYKGRELKFSKVLKSKWGCDPLFLGSYSYVAVGSSSDDLDKLAEPLPKTSGHGVNCNSTRPLQILFAGEATHRTHYATTHGAYFSGLREANRLLQRYRSLRL